MRVVSQSSTQTKEGTPRSTGKNASFGHLLVVWVLVGASLMRLGMNLYWTASASLPIAEVSAGMVFGTIAIGALWVVGFRPSLRASALYFIAEQAIYLTVALVFLGANAGLWQAAGVSLLSISGAVTFSFTDVGRRGRRRLRNRGRQLLQSLATG